MGLRSIILTELIDEDPTCFRVWKGKTGRRARLERSNFFMVVLMSLKSSFLVMLLLIIGCQQAVISQEQPTGEANLNGTAVTTMPDKQLEINKNVLLMDPNEENRITVANLLLLNENPQARQILIEALSLKNNSAARMAICRALIHARSSKVSVSNMNDFIQPLFGVFNTENDAEARLAAEATLIYGYDEIREILEKLVTDTEKPVKTRVNAIGALNRPDMNAIIMLIRLVDDPQEQVVTKAERTLRLLGIPVGTNRIEREKIIADLLSKGMDAVLQDLLINQEAQMREIRIELESWKDSYLVLLGRTYRNINDDSARGKFLIEYLGSPKAAVRLWALDQVFQWIKGTNRNLPKELEPLLKNLISDQDKKVRLKTAELLALMRTINSASSLLAQLKIETDEQVRGQLLDTLGWVCFYALSPNSQFKITPETRQQALGWAETFLLDEDANKAQIGARVMKKLLERDGLRPEEADKKLNLLVERYNRQKSGSNETLRGALLNAMAGLVAQDSAYKVNADKLFRQFFLEALSSKTDLVRESAVEGLANIDKTSALITLRTRGFHNDPSPNVRSMQIELAKNVGGIEDLSWLAEKIGTNSESQQAWQAMFTIFGRSDANVLNEWIVKLTGDQSKLSDNQKIDFLKIAEAKAIGENKMEVRRQLAELFYKTNQFEQAAEYFGRLTADAQSPEQQKLFLSKQLEACLRWPNIELAADLLKSCLSKGDLEPNDVIIRTIDNYLDNQTGTNDIEVLLKSLADINVSPPRPKWGEQVKYWVERFRGTSELDKEETRVNL